MNTNIEALLEELIKIPSPTGMCGEISKFIRDKVHYVGFYADREAQNNRGHLRFSLPGKNPEAPKLTWVSHADTLGVKINHAYTADDGFVYAWLMPIGGLHIPDVINMRVIFPFQGRKFTGTVLFQDAGPHIDSALSCYHYALSSAHEGFLCRLDTHLALPKNTIGYLEPRYLRNDEGLIMSRHLDSKADVAVMLSVMLDWAKKTYMPPHPVDFVFNMDEEPGIATDMIAEDTDTCIALEFIPSELGCSIRDIGIIQQDEIAKSTPQIINLLQQEGIKNSYIVPRFGSDATLAVAKGATFNYATIGFGLDKSHGAERTHVCSLETLAAVVSNFTLT